MQISKQFISSAFASLCLLTAIVSTQASASIIAPEYIVNASINGDSNSVGAVGGNNFDYINEIFVRERKSDNQQLRTASFVQFDLTGLTASIVNSSSFSASFEADLTSKLNPKNDLAVMIGAVNNQTWDNSLFTGTVPLFEWAADSLNPEVFASNVNVNIATAETFSVDVTNIVRSWVNGDTVNNGFVLYGNARQYQGAAFENTKLSVQVPEPTSIALMAIALIGFVARRSIKS
ncbi:PEP-CTERM sorting domain-containing protein [Colwellia sp. E2M01]|uniref:PEP-CTERM sorting domain-containing protein n=1 Tax=Colwellia sp. E2M01 TaxID=2841561 RepID=UPI001C08E449|nr:PEP-CTERM sorting domain-containing protein [Colwellia sp. E2M01]MBU2871121.1 DNRLRE domain-containing protein [Colwellia sp. E2M01]